MNHGEERNIGRFVEARRAREPGLPGRPSYRNLYAATDPDSGYSAWMLPGLRSLVEGRNPTDVRVLYVEAVRSLAASCTDIGAILDESAPR